MKSQLESSEFVSVGARQGLVCSGFGGSQGSVARAGFRPLGTNIALPLIYLRGLRDFIVHLGGKSAPAVWTLKHSCLCPMLRLQSLLWIFVGNTFPREHSEAGRAGGAAWRPCSWGSYLCSCQTAFHVSKILPPFFKRTRISSREAEGTLLLEGEGNNSKD